MTITEALLATLATPPLFDSISIIKDSSTFEYISGDLAISNPTRKVIAEAKAVFGSEGLVACVVNIGCGHPGIIAAPDDSNLSNWNEFLENLVTDNEQAAQEIQAQMDHLGIFQRLSVTLGLEGRPNNAVPVIRDIFTHTEAYLADGNVIEKMEVCIDALKTRLGVSSLEQLSELHHTCYSRCTDTLRSFWWRNNQFSFPTTADEHVRDAKGAMAFHREGHARYSRKHSSRWSEDVGSDWYGRLREDAAFAQIPHGTRRQVSKASSIFFFSYNPQDSRCRYLSMAAARLRSEVKLFATSVL